MLSMLSFKRAVEFWAIATYYHVKDLWQQTPSHSTEVCQNLCMSCFSTELEGH